MERWLLRKHNKLKCIIYDPEILAILRWTFPPPDFTIEFEGKVATLQQPQATESHDNFPSVPHPGVEEEQVFDCTRATHTNRKCAINVSYTVKHSIRLWIAHHPTNGTCRGETLDHPTGGAWFYRKLRKVWPAYVLKK